MSGKKSDGIDALVDDIKAKYLEAEFGKYRVTTVDSETSTVIFEKLKGFLNKRAVKIIFLVAEETDG